NIAPNVTCEVRRHAVQVSGRVAGGAGIWTAPAASDVVIAKHESVRAHQPDAERSRILHAVVRDPYRLSKEPLPKDGLSALGGEPVAAKPQRRGGCRVAREVDIGAVDTATDDRVG